jgi:nitroreductase
VAPAAARAPAPDTIPPGHREKESFMDDPVRARRSIRAYTAEPVSDEHVERLLRAAMAAPSAGNQQPWSFVVVTDHATLAAIPTVHPYSRMLEHAPLAIIVCAVEQARRWPQYRDQDCSAAVENILIEAVLLGLGAVWLGVYPLDERVQGLRRLLGIPDDVIPFAVVPVGHPAESKEPADRFDPERIHRERW